MPAPIFHAVPAWLAAIAAAPLVAQAGAGFFSDTVFVKELSPDDWKMIGASKEAWYVNFYANWCPHCQHFAPIWKSVASTFQNDKRVRFGGLDCATNAGFCSSAGIDGYPTMRCFNIPGIKKSFTEKGGDVHTGEYTPSEANNLTLLLRGKLAALGPDPPGAQLALPDPDWDGQGLPPRPEEPEANLHTATERLNDAEVALIYALHQGTALAAAQSSQNASDKSGKRSKELILTGDKLTELVLWLDYVGKVLPSTKARNMVSKLAQVARAAQDEGHLKWAAWVEHLQEQSMDLAPMESMDDPVSYFKICTTYTCGLWTLFHMLAVSAADMGCPPNLRCSDGSKDDSPEVLVRIRGFVANFFGCDQCARHFVAAYDGCMLERCDLGALDGRGAALWLWRMHNNVTVRVAGEQGLPIPKQWPPKTLCPKCWAADGKADDRYASQEIFHYITHAYRPSTDPEGELNGLTGGLDSFDSLGLWARSQLATSVGSKGFRFSGILIAALVLFGVLHRWKSSKKVYGPVPDEKDSSGKFLECEPLAD